MEQDKAVALLLGYGFEGYHHDGPDLMGRLVVHAGSELYQTEKVGSMLFTAGTSNTKSELVQAKKVIKSSPRPTTPLVVVCHEQHVSRVERDAVRVLRGHLDYSVRAAEDILLEGSTAHIYREQIRQLRASPLY